MSKKSQKKAGAVGRFKAPQHAEADPETERVIRGYREAVQRLNKTLQRHKKALRRGERDDLPRVKIPAPAVKPKGVKPQQIRKAVRKAVEEYSERHLKTLGRS